MAWALGLAAELPIVLLAFFGAMLVLGASYLLEAIVNALPPVAIPFTDVSLRSIFKNVIDPVRAFLLAGFVTLFHYVEGWFRAPAYTAVNGASKAVAAVWHHATLIQYLWGHAIPNSARAAVNTANAYSAEQLQFVRAEIHAAAVKWENAHSYADAYRYIELERTAPSVEHAFLAGQARTMIAAGEHAQDLHDQLYDYIGRHVTGQADVARPYTGQTLTGVAGAIVIPGAIDLSSIDVQDLIKTGSKVAIGTAVAVIATKIVECLVSKCAGNNNFDNLLKDALGLLGAVEFASFVEGFVKDPSGTLTSYTTPFAGLIEGGATDAKGVWTEIESALGL